MDRSQEHQPLMEAHAQYSTGLQPGQEKNKEGFLVEIKTMLNAASAVEDASIRFDDVLYAFQVLDDATDDIGDTESRDNAVVIAGRYPMVCATMRVLYRELVCIGKLLRDVEEGMYAAGRKLEHADTARHGDGA